MQSVVFTRILLAAPAGTRDRLATILEGAGLQLVSIRTPGELSDRLAREDFDLVILHATLLRAESETATLASTLDSLPEHPALIVLAEHDDARERALLLASGCRAVLWLGLENELLSRALLSLARRHRGEVLERLGAVRSEKRSTLDEFVSKSPTMQRFLRVARRVIPGDSALLILGETGVGKERLARSIHSESARSTGPFITVNCGALPESLLESELFGHEEGSFTGATRARRGYFELAHGGTIFLDEIGEMPMHLQVKLLRVLEDRSIRRVGSETPVDVDVRVTAATNRDLKNDMEEKRFRPDLYYRLAVVTLTVPPLRERREDVPELARAFLARFSRQLARPLSTIDDEAVAALVAHRWPGNVRELINVIERAVLLAPGREIRVADLMSAERWRGDEALPAPATANADGDGASPRLDLPLSEAREEVVSDFERAYLEHHLTETGGRIGETARRASLNERTLYALMKRHGLRKEDYKKARTIRR